MRQLRKKIGELVETDPHMRCFKVQHHNILETPAAQAFAAAAPRQREVHAPMLRLKDAIRQLLQYHFLTSDDFIVDCACSTDEHGERIHTDFSG